MFFVFYHLFSKTINLYMQNLTFRPLKNVISNCHKYGREIYLIIYVFKKKTLPRIFYYLEKNIQAIQNPFMIYQF